MSFFTLNPSCRYFLLDGELEVLCAVAQRSKVNRAGICDRWPTTAADRVLFLPAKLETTGWANELIRKAISAIYSASAGVAPCWHWHRMKVDNTGCDVSGLAWGWIYNKTKCQKMRLIVLIHRFQFLYVYAWIDEFTVNRTCTFGCLVATMTRIQLFTFWQADIPRLHATFVLFSSELLPQDKLLCCDLWLYLDHIPI